MAILEYVDKELSTSDKKLSVLVYLELRNNMIEQYKDDIIYALCLIEISCDKRIIIHAVYYVMSNYRLSHNLGSHNVLLETNYDLWAKIKILGPLPTLTYKIAHLE